MINIVSVSGGKDGYICVSWSDAHINATLSADQLEAIARWMRDPEGVAP